MNRRYSRLDLDDSIFPDQSIRRIAVSTVVKKAAVSHVDKIFLFVQHPRHRFLFVSAFGMLIAKTNLRFVPVAYFQRDLERIASGRFTECLAFICHETAEL